MDHAEGMYATDTIYSDLDLAKLEALPRTQPHRIVDLTVVEADQQGWRICCTFTLLHSYFLMARLHPNVHHPPVNDLRHRFWPFGRAWNSTCLLTTNPSTG